MTRALLAALMLAAAAGAAGQAPEARPPLEGPGGRPAVAAPALQDTAADRAVSPGGAFLRSVLLPGWGQASFQAYFRGGVYFAGWAGNWFMNFRNAYRLDEARTRLGIRTETIRDHLIASSPNPDSMRAQIDSFPAILDEAVRADELGDDLWLLVDAREQQREDWIAWSIFWLLASGIDAYVTAQLSDFPAEVGVRPGPDGGVSLRVDVPLRRRR